MTRLGYRQSPEHIRARFAKRGIVPQTSIEWREVAEAQQRIAADLAAEVLRLQGEVDRLSKLGQPEDEKPPTVSPFRDLGHPCWPMHVAMNLDTQEGLDKAWLRVRDGNCGKCGEPMEPAHFEGYDGYCGDCQLLWSLSPGHFAFETPVAYSYLEHGDDVLAAPRLGYWCDEEHLRANLRPFRRFLYTAALGRDDAVSRSIVEEYRLTARRVLAP